MKRKLLIVDDEQGIVDMMRSYFSETYDVLTAYNGKEAIQKAQMQPDLILLDINMPGMDGLSVCRNIRNHVTCPILFLTARIESADQIVGFQAGGDDYIVKPFDLDELDARVAAHLRREQRRQNISAVKFFGELAIDYTARTVTVNGEPVTFSRREFDILELLSLHTGQVFDRERIYESIWGIDGEGSSDVVMEHVRKIRAKLAARTFTAYIETVWGVRVPMEGLKNMGLKRCFFLLSVFCLVTALLLTLGVYLLCGRIAERYPQGGIAIDSGGTVTELAGPDREQMRILELLDGVRLLSAVLFPAGGLGIAGILFYHLKLKAPIEILKMGTERIRNHDLDFSMPEASADELGQICAAFEMMREELLKTNRKLWQQAEERKRLNAAFAHDLRNPVTVLKGSVKLMKGGRADEHTLERMERYVLRVEQYVEAMSSIQRLEQIQVRLCDADGSALLEELQETAHLLAPGLDLILSVPDLGIVRIDHGIFLTVAENLIGNAARFACRKLEICLTLTEHMLCLMVVDDGPGFPPELVKNGPKPFGKIEENAEHFGMGLYSSSLLCLKHGGKLCLENRPEGGGAAVAFFSTIKS